MGSEGRDAAAWFSPDGLTGWSAAPIPFGRDTTLTTVAYDGRRWFAAGVRVGPAASGAARARAVIWRSPNGRRWELVDSHPLGPCYEGCPFVGQLAAGSNGVILSGIYVFDTRRSTIHWLQGGDAWHPVDKAVLGLRPQAGMGLTAAIVVDGRFIVVGAPAKSGIVWSSDDGLNWPVDAALDPRPSALDVASDGRSVVVVGQDESQEDLTRVWTSPNGRADWAPGSETLPIGEPHVAFAGGAFVAAGGSSTGNRIFSSPDGSAWTELAYTDPTRDLRECRITTLVGIGERVYLIANEDCSSGMLASGVREGN